MFIYGSTITLQWVLLTTPKSIVSTDLDIIIFKPDGNRIYTDDATTTFTAPTANTVGEATYDVLLDQSGKWEFKLTTGAGISFKVLDSIEIFVFYAATERTEINNLFNSNDFSQNGDFDLAGLYLGIFSSNPANTKEGVMYFNTTTDSLWVLELGVWTEISGGSGTVGEANTSEYCPGYPVSDGADGNILIAGFDVTNLFYVGRSVSIREGSEATAEVVTAVSYDGTDTLLVFQAALYGNADELCLASSALHWSPIAEDPFNGANIKEIVSGKVGSNQVYIAIGTDDKLFYSIDAGNTWTAPVVPWLSTSNLIHVEYNETNELFIVGTTLSMLYTTLDGGITWLDINGGVSGSDSSEYFTVYYDNIVRSDLTGTGTRYSPVTRLINDAWNVNSLDDNMQGYPIYVAQNSDIVVTFKNNASGGGYISLIYSSGLMGSDITSTALPSISVSSTVQHFFSKPSGSLFILMKNGKLGRQTGDINTLWQDNSAVLGFGASDVNGGAFSPTHNRSVVVGGDSKIAYTDDDGATWNFASNGFNPTAQINSVVWNSSDGQFIAVADNGQICRSTNGIS